MAFAVNFFVRRILQGLIIVVLVALLIFALLRIVPGDPVRIILGPMATASVMEETAQKLGLRDPIPVQFGRFAKDVVKGDFGRSYIRGLQGGSSSGSQDAAVLETASRAPVIQLIMNALPYSLMLGGLGIFFALLVALPIGIYAGLKSGSWPDRVALYISSLFVSLPNIWVGVVLIFLISAKLGWLPAIGYKGFSYAVLPAIVLAIEISPIMIRAISVSVATAVGQSYVDVGVIRGLPYSTVVRRHVLRNASIPLLNLFGAQLIGILLGSIFVIEYIFSYPGVGLLTINAVFQRDFPIIQAVAILASGALVTINMLVDFTSTSIDRRLKF